MIKPKQYSSLPAKEKADIIMAWMAEHKARNLVAMDMAGNSPLTEVMVVASASSTRHARSLADGLMELCSKENYEFLRMEGYDSGMWVLVDLNDIVVHIFQEPVRDLYNLESLWRDAVVLAGSRPTRGELGEQTDSKVPLDAEGLHDEDQEA